MSYITYIIDNPEDKAADTYLSFNIATTRSMNLSLMKLIFQDPDFEKSESLFIACLKKFKKKNMIDFFVTANDISSATSEAAYLMNKFPELQSEIIDAKGNYIFVKI